MPVTTKPLPSRANVEGSGTALSGVTSTKVVAGPSIPINWMVPPDVFASTGQGFSSAQGSKGPFGFAMNGSGRPPCPSTSPPHLTEMPY